jgi:hypothetical protein
MKYPKPGYHNPLVSVHVFDLGRYLEKVADLGGEEEVPAEEETHTLDWDGRRGVKDSVILEVACVGNGSLVVKEGPLRSRLVGLSEIELTMGQEYQPKRRQETFPGCVR